MSCGTNMILILYSAIDSNRVIIPLCPFTILRHHSLNIRDDYGYCCDIAIIPFLQCPNTRILAFERSLSQSGRCACRGVRSLSDTTAPTWGHPESSSAPPPERVSRGSRVCAETTPRPRTWTRCVYPETSCRYQDTLSSGVDRQILKS